MVQSLVRQSYPWWHFLWLTFHDNLNIFSFGGARNKISSFPIPMASTNAFGYALQVRNSLCVEVPERLSLLSVFRALLVFHCSRHNLLDLFAHLSRYSAEAGRAWTGTGENCKIQPARCDCGGSNDNDNDTLREDAPT